MPYLDISELFFLLTSFLEREISPFKKQFLQMTAQGIERMFVQAYGLT